MEKNLEGMNRAKRDNFLTYWKARPIHFKDLFEQESNHDNIMMAFKELKRKSLVCAVEIPVGCKCRHCLKKGTADE